MKYEVFEKLLYLKIFIEEFQKGCTRIKSCIIFAMIGEIHYACRQWYLYEINLVLKDIIVKVK